MVAHVSRLWQEPRSVRGLRERSERRLGRRAERRLPVDDRAYAREEGGEDEVSVGCGWEFEMGRTFTALRAVSSGELSSRGARLSPGDVSDDERSSSSAGGNLRPPQPEGRGAQRASRERSECDLERRAKRRLSVL